MTESNIVVVRLMRNLRYKLTYIKIFETYLESGPGSEVAELLRALIQAQQAAIAPLSSYLRRLDANTQDLELDQKLMKHALGREGVKAQLRFVHGGLERAVSWYKMQLVDRQMTQNTELVNLLIELGETDAAKLWRVEAVMAMLKISVKVKVKDWSEQRRPEPRSRQDWQPRLVEDVGRPSWSNRWSSRWEKRSGEK